MKILRIKNEETYPWLLQKHYAKRIPQIIFSFGLYDENILVGVITYGIPASPSLCMGICGKEWSSNVLELNRLCLENNYKNQASFLISNSIKLLPKPTIVVSYADIAQGHVGYVYQSTNFLYTGLSANRTDWNVEGLEHKHSKTLSDGMTFETMKEKYGDKLYYKKRSRKHRYIYFHGSKTDKKILRKFLKYDVMPYPKGDSQRYDSGLRVETQQLLL
jgi:hypothetical protein